MPFYEYACTNCGKPTTILQKLSDPPAVDCPACHTPSLTKQISAAGFRLKGAGWYETDFKSDNKRNLAGDSAESAVKPDKVADKPAAAPAAAAPAATPAAPTTPVA
ncbi:zinc ribbon domain-containing protein [uncultured Nevskia sp.]|uniref:FmdB family zinc ribbon protein n=1 Tax=uncultured Nevskia sp. TaxID=228950 RepID=UPI0025CEAD60|nr:zinc ribbon domain-containing protein [uncultured Nevskia sp.]